MTCQRCWRPVLESHGAHLYCPTCNTEYSSDLEITSGPSIEVFHRNVVSLFVSGGTDQPKCGVSRLADIPEKFGVDPEAPAEKWIMAVHHLKTLYGYYRTLSLYPGIRQEVFFPPPASKRAYPGSFYRYDARYWRRGVSPFTSLSDNAFIAVMSLDKSSKCFSLPPVRRDIVGYNCGGKYRLVSWQSAAEELLSANLINKAPIEENLCLITFKEINERLKEHGIKSAKVKSDAIISALRYLPESILKRMTDRVKGYEWASRAVQELRLWEYEIRNLGDSIRYHNLQGDKLCADEFMSKWSGKYPDSILETIVFLLDKARRSATYNAYLEKGSPPAEAKLAEAHAQLGHFDAAYREVKLAYSLDTRYNEITELTNITHFGSLIRFQRQLEIIMTQFLDPPHKEMAGNISDTENLLRKWTSLYDRANSNGFTFFLLSNYENVFATMGNCSTDSENKYREMVGVPRIGEGWVSEVELLNLVKEIFPKERVIHQASPEWLGLQRLDIYLPRLKIAVEYQGRQHYEPVPFFGGEKGFSRTQELDRRKVKLCSENGVEIVYFSFDEKICHETVNAKFKQILSGKYRRA